jgi:hypothetical protein
VFENDFLMGPDLVRTDSRAAGEVVFAGHGITAPELHVDDFAGIDVRGKVVCLLSGAPSTFPSDQRAHYSHSRTKEQNLVAHGAIGFLTVRTPIDDARQPWARSVRQSRQGSMRSLDASGAPQDVRPTLLCSATLSRAAAESLFAGGPRSLAGYSPTTRSAEPMASRWACAPSSGGSHFESVTSPNVVGSCAARIPSSATKPSSTPRLDHLGITTPVDGDSINNGALDNGSGSACLLESRVRSRQPEAPATLDPVLAVTGEERGFAGIGLLRRTSDGPRSRLVADLMDEFLMLFPVQDVVAFGAEHSTLGDVAAAAAKPLGYVLSPDPAPVEVSFVRSDQYSFVRRGIPSLALVAGRKSTQAGIDGDALVEQWLHATYHSPKDDMAQSFDYPSIVRYARLNFAIGRQSRTSPASRVAGRRLLLERPTAQAPRSSPRKERRDRPPSPYTTPLPCPVRGRASVRLPQRPASSPRDPPCPRRTPT